MVTNNSANIATGASGTILRGAGVGTAPTFSTATYPNTAGTSGNVLTSDGTNWNSTAAATGGALVFISQQDQTNQAAISFTSGISATYDNYFFTFKKLIPITTSATFFAELSVDGGSNWISTGYNTSVFHFNPGGTGVSGTTANIRISASAGMLTSSYGGGYLYLYGITSNVACSTVGFIYDSGNTNNISGGNVPVNVYNAIRFVMSTGNITGVISMYGIKES